MFDPLSTRFPEGRPACLQLRAVLTRHPLARLDVPSSHPSTAKQNLFDPEPGMLFLATG